MRLKEFEDAVVAAIRGKAVELAQRAERAEARAAMLEDLLRRAVPLAAYAQDIPSKEVVAQNWHDSVHAALGNAADSGSEEPSCPTCGAHRWDEPDSTVSNCWRCEGRA